MRSNVESKSKRLSRNLIAHKKDFKMFEKTGKCILVYYWCELDAIIETRSMINVIVFDAIVSIN